MESQRRSCICFFLQWSSLIGICEGIRVELIVIGEALGFVKDELLRNHLPRMFSLITNESKGIEDINRHRLNHKSMPTRHHQEHFWLILCLPSSSHFPTMAEEEVAAVVADNGSGICNTEFCW